MWLLSTMVVVSIAMFMLGVLSGINAIRREAIGRGVAHWSIDRKTGERSFVWGEE